MPRDFLQGVRDQYDVVVIGAGNTAMDALRVCLRLGAESVRCVICIRNGWWPQRLQDVEELEQQILAEAAERREAGLAR